jgi:carbamoyltransferase
MSRIMPVKEDKRSVIPGVTHVDGTARIQTVEKSFNEKYWNVINAFKEETGVPMLLNTSFNCQEPIVETPQEALATFNRVGLDILVIEDYVVVK